MNTEYQNALRVLMNDDLFLTLNDREQHQIRQELVLAEKEPVTELQPAEIEIPEFEYLGKNLQHFLILTGETFQENHLKALESTLLRKQLMLDDVAVVDHSIYQNANFAQLHAVFMPQKLVCFGVQPETLGLPQTEINQITRFETCQILFTYSFNEMLGNKEKTKAFWEPMKNL